MKQFIKNFYSKRILLIVGIFVFGIFFFILPTKAEVNHVVISEVQIAGQTADDEFVELFNPTNEPINLTGYVLKKKNSNGVESSLVVSSRFQDKIIQPKSFLLLAPEENYLGTVTPDIYWPKSYNLASNNTLILYHETTIIDKVGWGSAIDFETIPFSENPNTNQSLERKASPYSTQITLAFGGQEENSGNGWDTDNNNEDFILQTRPNPQNSSSLAETNPPLSGPPNQGPVCGNNLCENGEDSNSCPTDCPLQSVCGNGIIENDETCDDGNSLSGDGCSSICQLENSGSSSGSSSHVPNYQPQPGDVVINEIFPQPDSKKGEEEWIELYNKTDYVLDLSNWTIEDNTGKPRALSNLTLTAHGYIVLEKNKHFNFSLNNSGDILILKNGEKIIDRVTYGDFEDGYLLDNALNPGQSQSIGRNSQSLDTNNDKNDFFLCKNITPSQVNEIIESEKEIDNQSESKINQQNFLTPDNQLWFNKVFISEFLPNPNGSDKENEWIEIYNDNDIEIDLINWQIDDAEGGSQPYKISESLKIKPNGYLVLSRSQTKIALNNNFDSVRLINPAGQVQNRVDYQKPPEGASYARNDNGEWFYTTILTPGSANLFTPEEDEEEERLKNEEKNTEAIRVSIDELENLEKDDRVIVQGIVVAPPKLFAKTYFYLNGAQIYSAQGKFPDLEIGDLVEVEGFLSEAFNQKRIKIKEPNQIKILSHRQQIQIKKVFSDEISDELVGHLVEVKGQIIEKTGSKIYLGDDHGEIEIYLRPRININKQLLKEGQSLVARGILIEGKDNWQILPRFQDDLIITEEEKNHEYQNIQSLEIPSSSNIEIKNLPSSLAQLWSKEIILKYLLISAASLTVVLIALILKWKGIFS